MSGTPQLPTPADIGLFGPDSVTWRVHAEPVLLVGGLRALFLQALHPRAIAGVTQNSHFRDDPWGRLVRTINYVGTTIYGTTAQAQVAGDRVRKIHARLSATDRATGARFRVDEPELLRWVHVCEVDSYAETARRAGLRLSHAQWDAYWHEKRRTAALVGLDPATVPGSVAAARDYFAQVRPQLQMTPDAAETLLFLASPPPPWRGSRGWRGALLGRLGEPAYRLAHLGIAAMAFGLLPAWARRMYGGLGLPTTDLASSLSARSLRAALGLLPHRLYEGPMYRDAMARVAAAGIDAHHRVGVDRELAGTAQ